MDKTLIIVSAVVGSLGVLSAIFAFSAEGTKLTPYTILVYRDECIYPQNPALGLGVCAAIFLLAAQITFSAVGGCCGCCKKSRSIPSETKRILSIVCAVASWIAAVIAWVLLIEGVEWNENVVRMTAPNCYYLKDGVFAGAGVLSLAATSLGITSYIMTRRQRTNAVAAPAVPAKAEPQFLPPPPAQDTGPHAPNQELPTQGRPADAAPSAVASTPTEPSGLQPPVGVAMGRPLPQEGVEVPVASSAAPPANGQELSTVIRNEVVRQGIRLGARVMGHALLS